MFGHKKPRPAHPEPSLVERFFRDLTKDVVREASFGSKDELIQAITDYLAERKLCCSVLARTLSSAPRAHPSDWELSNRERLARFAP